MEKYVGLTYDGLNNLGDQIQSIATENLIGKIEKRFNRDTLAELNIEEDYFLIMNGWFSHTPKQCLPTATGIKPVFWGFHIANNQMSLDHFFSDECVNFFKKHEPVGCRDSHTAKKLKNLGVHTFYSKCLTLTLEKRKTEPINGWNVVVDVPIALPSFIENNVLRVSQRRQPEILTEQEKISHAQRLLDLYREKAKLVITTRLHCALPCVAMGIPVILLGNPDKYRLSIAKDVGLNIYNMNPIYENTANKTQLHFEIRRLWAAIDWNTKAIDFEKEKEKIISNFKNFLKTKINKNITDNE